MSDSDKQLNEDYAFFRANKQKFLEDYKDKFLLIHDKKLIEVFENQLDALKKALEVYNFKLGTFLIQQCVTDEDEMMKFYSRVSFASYETQRI